MPSILIVEDNEDIIANIYAWLEPKGYQLDSARNGLAALDLVLNTHFDCVILDLMLPGMDGLQLCEKLRKEHNSSIPIIMLTARDSVDDRVKGLNIGADDYIVKPFSLKELEARIGSLLRRKLQPASGLYVFGEVSINFAERRVFRQGVELKPGPTAYRILELLVKTAPGVVPRETLEEMLWGDTPPATSALRNHILELRRVLDKPFSTSVLETVPHVGYRLRDGGA